MASVIDAATFRMDAALPGADAGAACVDPWARVERTEPSVAWWLGSGPIPPEICVSDEQCREQVEAAVESLAGGRTIKRRLLRAGCVENPCDPRQKPLCACIFDPQNGEGLEGASLGGMVKGGCDVKGRGPTCLFEEAQYQVCDPDVTDSCDAQCQVVGRALDDDDARPREVQVRYARCLDLGLRAPPALMLPPASGCFAVVRIDDRCFYEEFFPGPDGLYGYLVPDWFERGWDCSLCDAEIVGNYFPEEDYEALGCTVSGAGGWECVTGGNGGCSANLCLDPGCYSESRMDGDAGTCSCPSSDLIGVGAGR